MAALAATSTATVQTIQCGRTSSAIATTTAMLAWARNSEPWVLAAPAPMSYRPASLKWTYASIASSAAVAGRGHAPAQPSGGAVCAGSLDSHQYPGRGPGVVPPAGVGFVSGAPDGDTTVHTPPLRLMPCPLVWPGAASPENV